MIRLSKSDISKRERVSVENVLKKGYLGMGPEVISFEKELKKFFKNKVDIACVNTGTSALQLALQAAGIGRGDSVIVPTTTYVASFQAITATGAKPIPCDIDKKTGWIDIHQIEKHIRKNTKAIMPVHFASFIGEIESIYAIARKYKLRVIEDAAHAFGNFYKSKIYGLDGDIICFSFDGIKNITCGEGGAIVSKDKEIIEKIRNLRLLGIQKDTTLRVKKQRSWDFDVKDQGWRYHMSDIFAAIGRVQLSRIEEFRIKRNYIVNKYKTLLKNNKNISFLDIDYTGLVPHIFPVLVKKRNKLRTYLKEHLIETGLHYKPNHLLTFFREKRNKFPVSEFFFKNLITLPLHTKITYNQIKHICTKINEFY